jgi:NodT family efflux transporter outer membrane factor (OMF) lipoprotein
MKLNFYKLASLNLFTLLFACKTLNYQPNIKKAELPKSFNGISNVSENSAKLNWKKLFSDSLLVSLIDTALSNNIDLQIALQRLEISRNSIKFQKGEMLPKVMLNTAGGIRKFGLYTMDGAGNISTEITPGQIVPIDLPDMFVGFQSSWEIDVWGKLKNQKKSAVSNYLASMEAANWIVCNLVNEIAMSYYELLALDHELDIITKSSENQREALEIIKVQKETGKSNELAVKQFSAQLLNNQSLEQEIKQEIVKYENKINFLLGRFPQKISRNKDDLFLKIFENFSAGVPSELLQNRTDIREMERNLASTKFSLSSAKASFYPNLLITSGIGFQAFNLEYLFLSPASLAYNVLGNLTAPLINRNAIAANYNNAKNNQLVAMYNYQKSIINAYTEVVNHLNQIESLQKINTLKSDEVKMLEDAVLISVELFKYGRATYLEVLFSQKNSMQSQLELIQATKRKQISMLNLYKSLGGGWQ